MISNNDERNTINEFNQKRNEEPVIHSTRKLNKEMIPDKYFGGLKFDFIKNPLTEIENCTGIIIKQQPQFFELISGFERNIAYHIFGETAQGYKYLFKCEEDTGCLIRWLCPTGIRKLNMNLIHIDSPNDSSSIKKFGNSLKPFKCPCFCLCRPEIFLTLDESNENIGKIREPFSCCNSYYEIYDDKDKIKYYVKAKCCQCGLLFSNSIFGKIGEAIFSIIDPESNEQVGTIIKKSPIKSNEAEKENYKIIFPDKANADDKLLLTVLGLMIDYQYFEIDPSKM